MNFSKISKDHIISHNSTAREALKMLEQLPDNDIRTLFVVDSSRMVGTLTDGDIRRGLLEDREISEAVALYMNRNFKRLRRGDIDPEILKKFRSSDIYFLPILNDSDEVVDVINLKTHLTVIPAAALIMAGGRGERLRPLTDSVPKPMLKVGEKPIIEINIDRLIKFGIKRFYISIKYLGDQIKDYFGDGSSKGVKISYIEEEIAMGTLGASSRINDLDFGQLLVMNSDILTNIDFEDFYSYFQRNKALMCAASIPYNVKVPYGIMEMDSDNCVTGLVEKPTYTYYANAGIYMIRKELLGRIPASTMYNATDLMQTLIDDNDKLVHYPILQYWLDIGRHQDYLKAQEDFKHINF